MLPFQSHSCLVSVKGIGSTNQLKVVQYCKMAAHFSFSGWEGTFIDNDIHWHWQIKAHICEKNKKSNWIVHFWRDLVNSSIPVSCSEQRQLWGQIRFLRVLSAWVLNMVKPVFEKQRIPVAETLFFIISILLLAVNSRCLKSYSLAVHVTQVGSSSIQMMTGTELSCGSWVVPNLYLKTLGFWHY